MSFQLTVDLDQLIVWNEIVKSTSFLIGHLLSSAEEVIVAASDTKVFRSDQNEVVQSLMTPLVGEDFASFHLLSDRIGSLQITIGLYYWTENPTGINVSIEPYGWQRIEGGLVLAAAYAIALARETQTSIGNEQLAWGSQLEYKQEDLFNLLRCQSKHNTVEESVVEVLKNIERAKREH